VEGISQSAVGSTVPGEIDANTKNLTEDSQLAEQKFNSGFSKGKVEMLTTLTATFHCSLLSFSLCTALQGDGLTMSHST
jgi:hypothetical protein